MARKLPSLTSLRAFEAAARLLSFTRAADELHVTPTAISHQIKALEEWLGVRLFDRSTRAVQLTDTGTRYLPSVQAAFDSLEIATQQIAQNSGNQVLTVTTTVSFTSKWLIPRLASFQEQYPDIDVRITTSTGLIELERAGIDLGIRFGRGRWPGLSAQRLLSERIFPVCGPQLLNGSRPLKQPEDLRHHTLLHVSALRDEWKTWLTANGLGDIKPARELTFDQIATALQAASEGLGIALGYTHLVADDLNAGRLLVPFKCEISGDFAYYVVYPESAPVRPHVAAFKDWLLAQADGD
jgi:LysR family glycine cleavage system transcriptional activator